jgi:hypothetical protein
VAELAFEEGPARAQRPENITAFIQSQMFEPNYPLYVESFNAKNEHYYFTPRACENACPIEVSISHIARFNREFLKVALFAKLDN